MIEITHAPEDRKRTERKIPKNIRQIGDTSGYAQIYMEDMVYQFLSEGGIREDGHLATYLLLGEEFYQDNEQYIFIRSAMELENITYQREFPVFSEDVWNTVYCTIRKNFPAEKILGWAENRKGGRLSCGEEMEAVCRKHFHGENQMVLLFDTEDADQIIYLSHNGHFVPKNGFHIYYEKNSGFSGYLSDYHDRKEQLSEKNKRERILQEKRRLEEMEQEQRRRREAHSDHKDLRSAAGDELEKRFYEEKSMDVHGSGSFRRRQREEAAARIQEERFRQSPGWEKDTVARYREFLREKNVKTSSPFSKTAAVAAAAVLVIMAAFAFQNYRQLEQMENAVDAIAEQQAKEDVLETISKKASELTGQEEDTQQQDTQQQDTQQQENTQQETQTQNTSGEGTSDAAAQTSAQTNEYLAQGYYVVQQGDKLLDISRKVYGNDEMVAAICEANGITDVNHIQTGDRLTLPAPR